MSLSAGSLQAEFPKWNMMQELKHVQGRVESVKSQLSVAPAGSQETIKIYPSSLVPKEASGPSFSGHTQVIIANYS